MYPLWCVGRGGCELGFITPNVFRETFQKKNNKRWEMKWPSASFNSTWRCFIPMSSHNALRVKKSRRNCVLKSRVFYLPNGDFLIFTKTSFRFVSFLVRFICSFHLFVALFSKMLNFLLTIKKFCQLPKSEEWKASNVYYNEASTTTEIKPLLTVLKSLDKPFDSIYTRKSAVFFISAKAFDSRLVD